MVTAYLKSNISKTEHLTDKFTIAQLYETIPNISNGTMFIYGDID